MTTQQPPVAAIRPKTLTQHNHERVDNYFWLRDKKNPEVLAYLEAETAYMEAETAHTKALQETLFAEMKGRIQETDQTVPVQRGDVYYYARTVEGLQYTIYCRKSGSLDAEEQVLVDLNAKAEGEAYMRLGIFEPSPDNRVLAYSLDNTGAETYTIHFLDMETGDHLPDTITGTSYAAEWANDNRTFFYTTEDDAKRNYRLWRHALGTAQADDGLVYQEDDALFSVYVYKTQDQAYLVLGISAIETREMRVLDANAPTGEFSTVHPRETGLRYSVEHRDGLFYVVTNADDSPNNKVMRVSAESPAKANWETFIPHDPAVRIADITPFADHLVVQQQRDGLPHLAIHRFSDASWHTITMPEAVYTVALGANPTYDTARLRFIYNSLTTSASTYDYDMNSRERTLRKQQAVLGGYDAADYSAERVWATADDGTQVPISLVYRNGMQRDGDNPLLMYGYGSYGFTYEPSFDYKRLCLLNRGFIVAIAHIRGGQEMGRHWYDQGKFLNKKNTFTDFIACAEHLIAEGYTRPEKLAISGRSAGGLLMGAVTNMAPELFEVVYAGVPFVDVVTTMLDESIPLTVGEFDEWGNPKDETYYHYMRSYSPYDNVEAKEYPHILVTAGLNDPRVHYWEPAKWVAKLRALKTDSNRLLLKMHMGAGHFSSSGRYDFLKDYAFEYAFILDTLGFTA